MEMTDMMRMFAERSQSECAWCSRIVTFSRGE
jgi:hypothetical protein